jgi:hypothetical protein
MNSSRNYPFWIAIALVALYVGTGGIAKLAGAPYVHSSFPKLGLPAWFGYFLLLKPSGVVSGTGQSTPRP